MCVVILRPNDVQRRQSSLKSWGVVDTG